MNAGHGRWLLAVGLAIPLVLARIEEAGDPVPVYTNEDLEKYPPLPSSVPVPQAAEDWTFVLEFLDRQHARIDADRRHDLLRSQLERPREVVPRYSRVVFPGHLHRYGHRFGCRARRADFVEPSSICGPDHKETPGARPLALKAPSGGRRSRLLTSRRTP